MSIAVRAAYRYPITQDFKPQSRHMFVAIDIEFKGNVDGLDLDDVEVVDASPDTNIDHRRVPNLQKFLERADAQIPTARTAAAYLPGDLVTWMLPGNLPHIGIVSDRQAPGSGNPLIIHNIGAGPAEEDMLFAYPITGYYRYRVQ